eukprot:g6356.t1
MAYATSPSVANDGDVWITNSTKYFMFKGDYRDHLHMEDPSKPLYANQLKLPSLPIPNLKDSCEVYLHSVRALANDDEYEHTRKCVEEFLKPGGAGVKLQERLLKRKEEYSDSSWLQHWWNTGSYLEFRMSNVINVSYFFGFTDLPLGYRSKNILRAALLTQGALKFRQKLCNGVDVNANGEGVGPGCATPYKYMFNACRIPLPGCDQAIHYLPDGGVECQNIVVIRHGQFFTFPASQGPEGKYEPMSLGYLQAQFRTVIGLAGDGLPSGMPPVGAMCGANRDSWSAARAHMVADPSNQEFLDAVQSAIFCVCLDSSMPVTRTETARALWHGESKERWYDKSLQIIVFENGKAGLMGEHSNYDGLPVTGFANYLLKYERGALHTGKHANPQEKAFSYSSNGGIPPRNISKLLQCDTQMTWDLNNAIAEFQNLVDKHDLTVMPFYGYGKKLIKSLKCSPDAFAQMAIQLAYKRMFGTCRATYEPLSMRKYRHGRTETIRSVSVESQKMVKVMDDPNASNADRADAIRTACAAHGTYIKKASRGNVCDRHLMGLSMLVGANESTPNIFKDPMYWKSKTWHLSTSNLSNELFDGWGWGEVVPDGLGVAYSTNNDMLLYNVTSARGFSAPFCNHVERALRDMVNVMRDSSSKL